jgi:NAD(P)-dependent dehydrogenase (short-subunit alcohol dehydrogenase family)
MSVMWLTLLLLVPGSSPQERRAALAASWELRLPGGGQLPDRVGRPGSIVNVFSMASRGAPLLTSYSAAEAGWEAFSRTAALEWGTHGIPVDVVSPGTRKTPRQSGDIGERFIVQPRNSAGSVAARTGAVTKVIG